MSPADTSATDTTPPPGFADPFESAAAALALPQRNWGWIVARGVMLILLGIVALLAPGVTLFAFTMVFAAVSLVDGVFSVIAAVRGARDSHERWGALLFSGLAGIAVGVLFILFPLISTFAFAFVSVIMIGAWAAVTGVLQIIAAIRLRKVIKGEWLMALSGLLSLLLAAAIAYFAMTQPRVTALTVAWLIGIYALVGGVTLIVLGLRLRKAPAA